VQVLLNRKRRHITQTGGSATVRVPKNHSGQQILEDYQARFNVAQCGRRLGKTTFGKRRALRTVLRGRSHGWFAPTYKLLSDAWRDLQKRLTPIVRDKSETEKRLELINGGVLEMWTLDSPDAGRGKDYDEITIDEAGLVKDLKERWENDIRPTLTIHRGGAWFLGTPKGRRYFHTLFEKGQAHMLAGEGEWASFRMPSVLNPKVLLEEIMGAKRDLPEDAYKQEYLGEPSENAGNPFGLLAIAACAMMVYEAIGSVVFRIAPQHREGNRYCAGIDIARAEDYTVVCIMDVDTGQVVALDRFQLPWEATVPRIAALINEYRAPFAIDATGVGDKVARDVLKACKPQGELFVFTGPSKQGLMERLMTALHRKEVRYPRGWLVAELESFGYEYTKHGVRYEAPQGLHDDGVIALGLVVYARDRARLALGQTADKFRTVRR
jgi:hypothetical protein